MTDTKTAQGERTAKKKLPAVVMTISLLFNLIALALIGIAFIHYGDDARALLRTYPEKAALAKEPKNFLGNFLEGRLVNGSFPDPAVYEDEEEAPPPTGGRQAVPFPAAEGIKSLTESDQDVHVVLIHGMKQHPLGTNGFHDDLRPELAGLKSYQHLRTALGYWRDPWAWERKFGQFVKWPEAEAYPVYETTRNAIVQKAVHGNFVNFITRYCQKSGRQLPEQLTREDLRPLDLEWSEPGQPFFPDPASLADHQVPFLELKHRSDVLGFLYRLTARPPHPGSGHIHFYVVVWNVHSSAIKENVYGSWDNFDFNRDRKEKPFNRGITGDYEWVVDQHRMEANRWLKRDMLNWGFTDASIYLHREGFAFEWAIAEALTAMGGHLDAGNKDRIILVTESLGSTITLNTVNQMLADRVANPGDGSFRLRHARFPLVDPDLTHYTSRMLKNNTGGGSEFDQLRATVGIPHFVKDLRAKGPWQSQALLKLGQYMGDHEKKDKVLFFMFANQFGLIEAGAGTEAKWRIEDFNQSFRDLSNELPADPAETPGWAVSREEYRGVFEAFLKFATLVETKGKDTAMKELESRIDSLTPAYYRQVGKLDEKGTDRGQFDVQSLQIVSFYDPNDLLGYPLPSGLDKPVKIPVKNVYVENGGKRGGFRVGDRDFGVCDPGRAHTGGYQRNDKVFDTMWEMKGSKAMGKTPENP